MLHHSPNPSQLPPFTLQVDLPDTVRPLLNVTCRAQRSEDARPALRLELLAQQPQGIYVLEVTARNPSETELGSWTFDIFEPWSLKKCSW